MYSKDIFPTLNIGGIYLHTSVKTSGTQQRRIENVGTVRSRDQNDRIRFFKSVHLDQKLIERLLAFIVSSAQASTTLAAHSIDFVDENNGRSCFFCLLKEVADARCTHTHKHFNKVGTRNRKEGNPGFSSHGLGNQRFSGTGSAYQ